MGLSKEELEKMAAVDVTTVDINTLTDIRDIKIDASKPVKEKLEDFAAQTANVYVHRYKDYVIKVSFKEDGPSIDERMQDYINKLTEINF